MLTVTYHNSSKGTLERRVRAKVDQIAALWNEIDDMDRLFKTQLQLLKPVNHIAPEFAYRLKQITPSSRELWHYNLDGQPIRKIATINEFINK